MFMLSVFAFLFCFYSYRDHRDLHSFPTRRSSDLLRSEQPVKPGRAIPVSPQPHACAPTQGLSGCAAHTHPVSSHWRSEEHTSELQSQFHLVCRLLLEKKNRSLTPSHPHLLCTGAC